MPKTINKKKALSKLQAAFFPEVNEIAGKNKTKIHKVAKAEKVRAERLKLKIQAASVRKAAKAKEAKAVKEKASKAVSDKTKAHIAEIQARERVVRDFLKGMVIDREVEADKVDDAQQKAQEEK